MTHPIPDDALDADIAILGKKGRGKTYTAKGIVERLLAMKRRVLVLDPLSTWWGLRSSASGASEGFKVAVFGGPKGDMPLTETMGRPLARIVAENNLPAVIDMGEMRKAAWQRLVRDMLDELFTENRDPLWIVLEEADVFAPQQPRDGDQAAVFGEVDRIARRGRAFGFRLISITQRPARLHKDVLTQLSTLVALGLTSPQDRDAIKAWVEGNADRDMAKEVISSLAKLPVGDGWVWAPDHDLLQRVTFPKITTLDTSATPKAGERRIEPKVLADVDLSAVKDALAKGEKGNPKVDAPANNLNDLREAEDRGYRRGMEDGFAKGAAEGVQKERYRILAAIRRLGESKQTPEIEKDPGTIVEKRRKPVSSSAANRMVAVLDTNPPIKMSWNALAASIGNKARGGHFNSVRKSLLDSGRVVEEAGLVRIATPSAQAKAPLEPDARADFLCQQWKAILGGRPAEIIDILRERRACTKAEIADLLQCADRGGHWNAAWKALRDNELVLEVAGRYRLTDELTSGAALRGGE